MQSKIAQGNRECIAAQRSMVRSDLDVPEIWEACRKISLRHQPQLARISGESTHPSPGSN
jgi:hypothetical protein